MIYLLILVLSLSSNILMGMQAERNRLTVLSCLKELPDNVIPILITQLLHNNISQLLHNDSTLLKTIAFEGPGQYLFDLAFLSWSKNFLYSSHLDNQLMNKLRTSLRTQLLELREDQRG